MLLIQLQQRQTEVAKLTEERDLLNRTLQEANQEIDKLR
jgi:hypothetical protein